MAHELLASTRQLSDAALMDRVRSFAARERDAMAQLIAHLSELETRELHLKAGYASLFAYCRDALCLSEHEAYNRIEAARAARRFPVILDMLADGSVNLTTIRLLAAHLTPENHRRVLDSALGKRKTEVEEIVAALAPRPDEPTSIRKLPASTPTLPPATAVPVVETLPASASAFGPPPPSAVATIPPPRSATAAPLAPDRYKLQVTISGETLEKLRLAADMLSNAVPAGDGAAVIDRALTALLAELAKKKFAATHRPRPSRGMPDPASRHVPAEVKRAVWVRDLGRCAFVSGVRRCDERRFLEFHHVKPYATGGEATVGNIQLRCRRHNQYEARTYYGGFDRHAEGEVRERGPVYGGKVRTESAGNSFWNGWKGNSPSQAVAAGGSASAASRTSILPVTTAVMSADRYS